MDQSLNAWLSQHTNITMEEEVKKYLQVVDIHVDNVVISQDPPQSAFINENV